MTRGERRFSEVRIAWSRESGDRPPSDLAYLGDAGDGGDDGDRGALIYRVRKGAPPIDAAWSSEAFFRSVKARGEPAEVRCEGAVFRIARGVVEGVCEGWSAEHELAASIALRLLLAQEGWIHLHAAGSVAADRAVLWVGGSGSGKTTTSLACLGEGHRMMSDDGIFVRVQDDHVEAIGVARPPHVTPKTAAMFPHLVLGDEVEGGLKRTALLAQESHAAEVFRVGKVMFPEIAAEETTRLESVRPAEALAKLLGSCTPAMIPSFPASVVAIDALCRLAELPRNALRLGRDAATNPAAIPKMVL